jgi:competence protein ComEC
MIDAFRKRPLFYAAILVALIIASARFVGLWPALPSDHIGRWVGHQGSAYIGGRIVSEVEERETDYHERLASFVISSRKFWLEDKKLRRVRGKVKVYLKNPKEALGYGDEIVIKGNLVEPKDVRNPGCFNQKHYLSQQRIHALFYGEKGSEIKVLSQGQGHYFKARAIEAKRFLSRKLSASFEQTTAGFLKALFLGERSDLENDFRDLFIKTGTMHIVAVSGFNIAFLGLTAFFLMKPFPLSRDSKLWLALILTWAYCFLVGWQAPVVRASIMASALISGQLLGRRTDVLNSLGLAALVILTINPYELFQVGFQLSFAAVFGMAVFLGRFIKKRDLLPNEKLGLLERGWVYFKDLFWVSLVCVVVTLPLTAQNFYIITPYAILSNLIVVPLVLILFFLGVIFFLTFWWLPAILAPAPLLIGWTMNVLVEALFFLENLPGASVTVGRLHSVFWWALTAGILWLLWDKHLKTRWVRVTALTLFIVVVFLAQDASRHFNRGFSMTVLDVGQGDAIYFEMPGGGNLLVDGGKGGDGDKGRWVVTPFLKSKGVRTIDVIAISHPHADHIGGLLTVLDEFSVRNVVESGIPYDSALYVGLQRKVKHEKAKRWTARRGMGIQGYRDVGIYVLNPSAETESTDDVNDASMVLKINYEKSGFLLAGDIGGDAMRDILRAYPDRLISSVLKVPHHGGRVNKEGEEFMRAVSPRLSVISVGARNPYHHPVAQTMDVLNSIPGNRLLRTDEHGAVKIRSDGINTWTTDWRPGKLTA